MTKTALIKEIVTKLEYTEDQLKEMSKSDLEDILKTAEAVENAEEIKNELILDDSAEEKVITPLDIEWTEYVLAQLDPKREIDNGNPRTDGLRRIAEKILGPFSVATKVVEAPNINNGYRASIVVSLEFIKSGLRYDGAADVYSGNTDKKFAVHALATAETRAEGRALRRALKLTKVLAAEETYNAEPDEPTGADSSGMPSTMLTSLQLLSNNTGVDLLKVAQKQGYGVNSLQELDIKQGQNLALVIGKIKRKEIELTDDIKI